MTRLHTLAKLFADGTPLTHKDLAEGRDAGIFSTHGQNNGWALTEYGANLIGRTRRSGDSASCPDEDSYWPPSKNLPSQADQEALNQHVCNLLPEYFKVGPGTCNPKVEQDPLGKHQHETGAKLDAGKVRLGLVLGAFSNALVEVGKVGTYGAQKYTDNGWLDVPKGKARYTDALLRHIFAEANESHDPDTNLHHAAHAAWNALARLELILRKRGDE